METIISIKGLSKAFGNYHVLKNINLNVKKANFITIFGPNGTNKTTLMKIMSTLAAPSGVSITIDKLNIKDNPVEIRKRIGSISHETYLYSELTAEENFRFFGRINDINKTPSMAVSMNYQNRSDLNTTQTTAQEHSRAA